MITAIAAAGVGALGNWVFVRHRRNRADDLTGYAAQLITDENFELRQRLNLVESYNAAHIKKIADLERQLFELRHKLEVMEFAPFSIPLPMWMKGPFGVIDFINDEYEETFLKPRGLTRDDYLGKTDFEIWPREVAEEYRKHDQEVMETERTFNGRETVVDNTGKEIKWRVMKFFRKIPRGVVGIAFPDNGYFETYFQQKNANK